MRGGRGILAAVAAALIVAGCGGGGSETSSGSAADATGAELSAATGPAGGAVKVIQPGAPGEPSREVAPVKTPAGGPYTPRDVNFMQNMIHHHQQAVVMAEWAPERTSDTGVRVMARRILVSQTDEMSLMRTWLTKRGVDPNDHSHQHHAMPGMVNSRQLDKLKAAEGTDFDRLFLKYMTAHHQGALTMVRELQDKGGGMEVEIGQFLLHVDSDQAIEIERMQQILAKL
jgi:uncharacterized protein (DUF305 family)